MAPTPKPMSAIAEVFPGLLALAPLAVAVGTVLALVGAADIPPLVRGEPVFTLAGAALLIAATLSAFAIAVTATSNKWLFGAYLVAIVGFVSYLIAATKVSAYPAAPIIRIASPAANESTNVTVTAQGLAFDQRLQVGAQFDDLSRRFERNVVGGDSDGNATHEFVVPPQSRERRLQVEANIVDADGIVRDLDCDDADAKRTCAEAARVIPQSVPEVRARFRGRTLVIDVQDRARIPGTLGIRVTRGLQEIFATRTRVDRSTFHREVQVPVGTRTQGSVCVAAAYADGLPQCDTKKNDGTIVRMPGPKSEPRRARATQPRVVNHRRASMLG
jgi:hypothetical protein